MSGMLKGALQFVKSLSDVASPETVELRDWMRNLTNSFEGREVGTARSLNDKDIRPVARRMLMGDQQSTLLPIGFEADDVRPHNLLHTYHTHPKESDITPSLQDIYLFDKWAPEGGSNFIFGDEGGFMRATRNDITRLLQPQKYYNKVLQNPDLVDSAKDLLDNYDVNLLDPKDLRLQQMVNPLMLSRTHHVQMSEPRSSILPYYSNEELFDMLNKYLNKEGMARGGMVA